jgi:hypothetical protein
MWRGRLIRRRRRSDGSGLPSGRSKRTARVVGGAVGLAVVGGVVGFLALGRGASTPEGRIVTPIQPNTLIRIDPGSMRIEARYQLSGDPFDIEFSGGRVWILEKGILEVLTPGAASELERTGLGFEPCSIAPADEGVIVGDCKDHRVYRVDADLGVRRWTDVPASGGFIQPLSEPPAASGCWCPTVARRTVCITSNRRPATC